MTAIPFEGQLKRIVVPAMENLMGHERPLLDHGHIRLIDYMGSDDAIVQAARVSYGEGTKSFREDEGLIRHLMRNEHTSPFEMAEIKLHCKMPFFVARQWIRHRTASVNEYSARYSVVQEEFYIPSPEQLAIQSTTNRQGRGDALEPEIAEGVQATLTTNAQGAYAQYAMLLAEPVELARELARMELSLNFYTEWYWKINLHNLLHFLKLRMDSHAQYEIRVYADAIADILKLWVPKTWQAFEDYQLDAYTLSGPALRYLKRVLAYYAEGQTVEMGAEPRFSQREKLELYEKLGMLADV